MKLTIVYSDNLVVINENQQYFDLSVYPFPKDFWALQWSNDFGEIEYKTQNNEKINILPDWTEVIIQKHKELKKQSETPPLPPTEKEQYEKVINQRNQLLKNSDWVVLRYKDQFALGIFTTLSEAAYQATLVWRQQLRDMPQSMVQTVAKSASGDSVEDAAPNWTWPPLPPELSDDFPDYPPT